MSKLCPIAPLAMPTNRWLYIDRDGMFRCDQPSRSIPADMAMSSISLLTAARNSSASSPGVNAANLASHNAGVTVAIVGLSQDKSRKRHLYDMDAGGKTIVREAPNITPYLTVGENVLINGQRSSISDLTEMSFGNMPVDGGGLLLTSDQVASLGLTADQKEIFVRRIYGSAEYIRGLVR